MVWAKPPSPVPLPTSFETIRARKMPTTMISVPKITLPPSAVTWARKIAIWSPPSCRAASIDAARMIATMAMLATIRDGVIVAGTTPVDWIA